ncbi:MAG: hypothetical protein ACOZAR_05140 [Patescibacteria group bacterium]
MTKKIIISFISVFLMTGLSGCWLLDFNARMAMRAIPGFEHNDEVLLNEARSFFFEKKAAYSAADWVQGPCLGKMNDEWVVDVVHNPRLPLDNDQANQCPDYYNKIVAHYILIDMDGKVVEMK